ncbi:plasmid maintenance system antidote protein, XRE family [Rhizobiales bacterium GAS191]|jgi:addiction module HigA family antidote|nr:plasmid maintenance system antidote protein, XRE family [Rhizobiales bacterium GAS113]SEE28234.1 plasmid maintenance system antidote protein, XRE family [Rhizobiales bacterium GAS188]SEE29629.1 plasmid maintenance system antidote protein, XRE family [Rhizobiales bacterium GAS191]
MPRRKIEIVETLPPMHPGEMLREEFLVPLKMAPGRLAKICGVPRTRIERIAREELGVTGDTALRLGKALGTTPEFWMNLQKRYELEAALAAIGSEIDEITPIDAVAA